MRILVALAVLSTLILAGSEEDEARKAEAAACARQLASSDLDVKMEGLRAAGLLQDSVLVAPLGKLLKDRDPTVRFAAIEALALRQLEQDKKKAATALAARLKPLNAKEETRAELLKVIEALHDLAQPTTIKALLDIQNGDGREVIEARARAVGNVPHKEAIKRLIQFGYKNRRGADSTMRAASNALRYATGEKIESRRMDGWRQWWKENEATFDFQAAAAKRAETRTAQAAKTAAREERKKRKRDKGSKADGE